MTTKTPIWHSPGRQLLVVAGLTGFAISQPLLSIFGDEPAIIAFHDVQGASLVAFAVAIALLPPLVLWGGPFLLQQVKRAPGRALHLVVVGALVGGFLVQVIKPAMTPFLATVLAIGGGIAFTIVYARHAVVAAWASYTVVLPFLAMASFLFVSPASALLSSPATAPEAEGSAPSVVMIVLDELPTRSLLDASGGIDPVRFPNLAGLAEDATWYRHHTSQATVTQSALPSLLTGGHPRADEPLFTNFPDNLFTLLAPTHELEVFETATHLCPYEQCSATGSDAETLSAGPGFSDLLNLTRDLWFERVRPADSHVPQLDDFAEEIAPEEPEPEPLTSADPSIQKGAGFDVTDEVTKAISLRAEAFASSFDAGKGPSLYFLHLLLPHQPWRHEADGTLYTESDRFGVALPEADRRYHHSWSPWVSTVAEQRHLLQTQYTDRAVGEVLDALEESGLYDSSLVLVTADHGVSFEEDRSNRRLTESTVDALAYTPLLVKLPGQTEGAVDDSNVMAIDVVPTIAKAIEVDVPWEPDGVPTGSDAIAARGTRKTAYDVAGLGDIRVVGTIEFDDAEEFATVPDRWIGPLTDPDDPLSALTDLLGLDDVIGARLDDITTADASERTVYIDYRDQVESPEAAPLTAITGVIDDPPDDGIALLVINGIVAGGSELSTDSDGTDGRLQFLIPSRVLEASNEVRVALQAGDQVTELTLR